MKELELGEMQTRFAEIIWANEPVNSGELVRICQKELNWKKPTTYTVLRQLCERGLFKNENSIVSSVISREEYYALKSEDFVDKTFLGSITAFIAAFMSHKELTERDIDEIQRMIDAYRKDH